ncbi:MAG: hypothetical protein DRJ03_17040 [Chloroflexi bacterium]|nr:MAG: hypothetical protein DRJ03_17040 [Chloroflexota bacterium]
MKEVVPVKRFAIQKRFVSHDFCDKCTWWQRSVDFEDVEATPTDTSYTTYQLPYEYIIDKKRISDRNSVEGKDFVVKVNGTVVTEGYTVNYEAGQITFDTALSSTDTVTASGAYATSSLYEITAREGYRLILTYVESQFTLNLTVNDALVFELVLNNESTGNEDKIIHRQVYYGAKDMLNQANMPVVIEPFAELTQKVIVLPWNYLTQYAIYPVGYPADAQNMEFNKLRLYLENDQPYTNCEIATGTFYCIVEPI